MDGIRRDEKQRGQVERTSSYLKRVDALEETKMTPGLNMVLLGKTGAGKSSTGNTILGRQAFISQKSAKSATRDVTVESGSFCELPVTVYDTPGFFDTKLSDEEIQQMINEKVLQKCSSGLWVFLLVIKADRFTKEDRKTVEKIEKMLGEKQLKNTWILFTRGDELEEENTTIQEFIEETEELKTLVQKYEHRYHVFNNKKMMKKEEESEQVKMLFRKILKPYLDSVAGQEDSNPNAPKTKIPEDIEPVSRVSSSSSRRIVLVGKSGVGKSAAGNTILGQKEFTSVMSMNSVTRDCSAAQATVSGKSVSVVDTPGFFDTQMKPEELMMEIARSVYISSPGPHAFLIVFPVNMRFTEQELQIPQQVELLFGQEVLKYSIILFTHGDQLDGESVEKLIKDNSGLRSVVQQCGGRYHVFNNRDVNNREQVEDLLQKIDSMVQLNGGGHYSNQMYKDAQRFKREEEERKLQDKKQIPEETERKINEPEESVKKETDEKKRKEKKESSGFMQFFYKNQRYFYFAAVVAGIAVGGVAGGVVVKTVVSAAMSKIAIGATVGAIAGGAIGGGVASGTVKGAVGGAVAGAAVAGAVAGVAAGGPGGALVGYLISESSAGTIGGTLVGTAVGGVVGGTLAGAVGGAVGGAVVGGVEERSISGAVAGFGRGAADGAAFGAISGAALAGTVGGVAAGGFIGEVAAGGLTYGTVAGAFAGGVVGGATGGAVVGGVTSQSLSGACNGAALGASVGTVVGTAAGAVAAGAVGSVVCGAAAAAGAAVGVCAATASYLSQTDNNL